MKPALKFCADCFVLLLCLIAGIYYFAAAAFEAVILGKGEEPVW